MGELNITVEQSWIIFKCLYMPFNAALYNLSLPHRLESVTTDGGFFMPFFRENGGLK